MPAVHFTFMGYALAGLALAVARSVERGGIGAVSVGRLQLDAKGVAECPC